MPIFSKRPHPPPPSTGAAPPGHANPPTVEAGPRANAPARATAQAAQPPPPRDSLATMLVRMGALSAAQLVAASNRHQGEGRKLDELLVAEGVVSRDQVGRAKAALAGVAYFDPAEGVDPAVAELIDEKNARRYQAVPVRLEPEGRLVVAMAEPSNVFAIDDLRILTGHEIRPALALPEEVQSLLGSARRLDEVVADAVGLSDDAEVVGAVEGLSAADLADAPDDAPVVRLVNSLIARAVDERASDIHFEPQAREMTVRYRVDGVLRTVASVPQRLQNGVASRVKIMADLDIAEKRVPQDGRVGLNVGGRSLDLRVASLPTVYGEKIVIRVLDRSNVLLHLSDLGFARDTLEAFEACYRRSYGALLVTGPTGSGKSTTLYGALNQLNSSERNIITVEDPVEYRLPGINQVQVNPKAGLSFANGLRSILRCDPDVVMIGEIRDRETAQIAIESALTGHLVLATIHTNDSAGAITRLGEMGVAGFLSSSAILGILAQRLARRLCEHCKRPDTASHQVLREAGRTDLLPPTLPDPAPVFAAVGCTRCGGTGYRGRVGVYEMLPMSDGIKRLAVDGESADEMTALARREGMRTLLEDGLLKVLTGLTSLEEVARAVA